MSHPQLDTLRASLVADRDAQRDMVTSAVAAFEAGHNSAVNVAFALREAGLLTAAIAELDAVNV